MSRKEHFKRKWKQNNEYQKNLTFEKQNRENISKIQEDIQPEHRKLRRKITHKTLVANEGLSINDTTNKKIKEKIEGILDMYFVIVVLLKQNVFVQRKN